MPLSKIKDEHKKQYVGFGKNNEVLGERDDIDELAIIAHQSGDKSLLKLFEQPMPSLQELQKAKADSELPAKPAAPVAAVRAATVPEQAK